MLVRPSKFFEAVSELNWFIIALVTSISLMGIAMMVSAGGGEFSPFASAQFSRFAVAWVGMIVLALIPMRFLMDWAYVLYFLCFVVLLAVDITGHIRMGAQRWLHLGGLNLQPSEFMKLALILVLARYFHRMHPEDIRRISFLIVPALLIVLPAVLILRQPNLGTTVILVSVGGLMCFMAGVQWRYFIGIGISVVAAAPLAWNFMHDYQKRRVLTFLDPQQDPLGAGYNILQSMIAIGSGGFLGKGFMQGSQNQLNFLPEKHTDFIFTMMAEEFGFLGSMLLLIAYGILLMCGILISMRSRSTFGALMAAGVTAMLFMHIFINCGMVMGMLPVVGVPLPLMSYGGSIMFSALLAMGLLLNSYTYRDQMPVRSTPKF